MNVMAGFQGRIVTIAAGVLLLAACATRLAPAYDQAIVDGLTSTNTQLMEFFAAAATGTRETSYADRTSRYDRLIGGLAALAIQVRARPPPDSSAAVRRVNERLAERGVDALDDGDAPSAGALDGLSRMLAVMRETDRAQGLTAMEVAAFRNQAVIYLDQAITYERFLQR